MNVYLLQHSHLIDDEDDTYDTKIIGIYSSEEIAMNVIKKYKKIIGFNKAPVATTNTRFSFFSSNNFLICP